MKRKTLIISLIMAAAAAIIMMTVIGAILTLAPRAPENPRFRVVEEFEGGCVWVDTETGVGYGQIYGSDRSLFLLYDTDGQVYRPNGWRDNDDSGWD